MLLNQLVCGQLNHERHLREGGWGIKEKVQKGGPRGRSFPLDHAHARSLVKTRVNVVYVASTQNCAGYDTIF